MNTADRLNNLDAFLHTISEENHAGLGGEAGYYVFSYDPKDEMRIRQWTKNEIELFRRAHRPVVEFDISRISAGTSQNYDLQQLRVFELITNNCFQLMAHMF